MQQSYKLKQSHYVLGVVLPTILTAGLIVWMLFLIISQQSTSFRLSLLALSTIMFFDYLVSLSHPNQIEMDGNSITFSSLNRSHVYSLDEIKKINIRPVSLNKRIYVRINGAGLLKGRYWIHLDYIENSQQLREYLERLVDERHPKLKNFNRNSFDKTK